MTTYRDAGVDMDAGDEFVDRISPLVRSTFRPEVLTDIGGFGGLFRLQAHRYAEPVLVSGTDGVGTKLKIAFLTDRHDTVGIDLVAMCVNDIVVSGAEPLFFLDYFATGKLAVPKAEAVLKGIAEGCRQAGCALIGGETAEMPSFYAAGEYDLAGFAVGVVDRPKIIDGRSIVPGDVLIGLASTGLHSNGYSLARRVLLDQAQLSMTSRLPELDRPLGEVLLTPTRIYAKQVLTLIQDCPIKGIAHITGGGITENLPRVFPAGIGAQVQRSAWSVPPIFQAIARLGQVERAEMYRVFNMGIGMILVVPASDAPTVIARARALSDQAYQIGTIVASTGDGPLVEYVD
ncbi:MAG: phosphoribosylformylglycinamidine cyclo-ligase [Nitrospiraceae bacterium]|nr:phosphoribosylformylglycinamidine cyclo-ligase [Nitrospira sp.]MDW7648906.1 phosphoribosylformylglycinamidine cyclo-ligase [Nitrospiraceae bacterium]GDX88293.1 phosphoribosylformylglycinamidine cyclo-ligase [Nitrospirota bacterium]MBP0121671.1 phosphoribosylformylglycinamidine cyclo-ligase [Nitrospira sp.]MBP0123627.1 phosphoribosylformylglycinamidine cyclo-ligase [Nitrospira sp.]